MANATTAVRTTVELKLEIDIEHLAWRGQLGQPATPVANRSPGRGPRARLRSWLLLQRLSWPITLRSEISSPLKAIGRALFPSLRESLRVERPKPKVDEALAVAMGSKPTRTRASSRHRPRPHLHRARHRLGDVERALLVQVVAASICESWRPRALCHLRPGRERRGDRHRRRRRVRVQDGEPQSSLVHRALSGRRDRGRRNLARRFTMGARPDRLPRFPPLRRARSCPNPAPGGRGLAGIGGYGNSFGVPTSAADRLP